MIHIFLTLLLLYPQHIQTVKYFAEEAFKEPGFNFSELEILEEYEQYSSQCPGVKEIIKVYKYPILYNGEEVNATIMNSGLVHQKNVVTQISRDPRTQELLFKGEFVVQPHLNCLDQEDPTLIQTVQSEYLDPPSREPYSFKLNKHYHADGQPIMLDQRYFQEQVKGGFFIEAGASWGEIDSTTLYFELKHGWSGLLVEPMVREYQHLRGINRRAWSVNTCLSPANKPQNVKFSTKQSSNLTVFGILADGQVDSDALEIQCLPLSTLILALGNPRVDFLSLDIEGAEMDVLKSILWDKIDVRSISVETQFLDMFDSSKSEIQHFLESKGFLLLDQISRDTVYVQIPRNDLNLPKRNLPTQSRQMSLLDQLTRRSYPLPRRTCILFNVPKDRHSRFCKETFPLDYYREMDVTEFPDCFTKTECKYTISSVMESLSNPLPWKLFLSDSCILKHNQ